MITKENIRLEKNIKIYEDYIAMSRYKISVNNKFLKDVEKKVGRTPSERWGPREIDLDILIFGDLVKPEGEVIIPHKGILSRDFVIKPLLELELNICLPGSLVKLNEVKLSELEKNVLNKLSTKITY